MQIYLPEPINYTDLPQGTISWRGSYTAAPAQATLSSRALHTEKSQVYLVFSRTQNSTHTAPSPFPVLSTISGSESTLSLQGSSQKTVSPFQSHQLFLLPLGLAQLLGKAFLHSPWLPRQEMQPQKQAADLQIQKWDLQVVKTVLRGNIQPGGKIPLGSI